LVKFKVENEEKDKEIRVGQTATTHACICKPPYADIEIMFWHTLTL